MHHLSFLYPALVLSTTLVEGAEAAKNPANSVLLSNVQTLTLRKDQKTSHRRVPPLPQLKCVGGDARGLYEVDVMRCKNQGSDYDNANIQWTCTASLPPEFKLGSTDVICEGYDSPSDPYILKGSCGVEYRLVLTDIGEEKFGGGGMGHVWRGLKGKARIDLAAIVFWVLFIGVLGWIIYSAFWARGPRRPGRPPGNDNHRPWGWGGGGGGGGGGDDDPPPPYDYRPPPSARKSRPSTSSRPATTAGQQGWRPGFWTGTLGGAAAGYLAGSRGSRNRASNANVRQAGFGSDPVRNVRAGTGWFGGGAGWDVGEGSSRQAERPSSSSPTTYSSTRYESAGFGSTSRR